MIVLTYPGTAYEMLLQRVALVTQTDIIDNRVALPESIGIGYFEVVNLPMGIQALLSDYHILEEVYLIREKSEEDFYNLRFELFNSSERTVTTGDESAPHNLPKAYAYLNSVHYSLAYKAGKGTKSKSLNLRFSRAVLESITGYTNEKDLLINSVTNTINRDNIIPATAKMIQLLQDVLSIPQQDPDRPLKVFNRSLLMTEYFFDCIKTMPRNDSRTGQLINHIDYEKMNKIEKIITADLGILPPTQEQLASLAQMSVSKLKYTFKKVYGTGLYQYFQKERMQRALQLLQEGDSVQHTAAQLGFKDAVNFTRNFKKQFNVSPSKVFAPHR